VPTVGFRLKQNRSALLSPSFDSAMFTPSPLSTQGEGWDDFVLDFAAQHRGVPLFNGLPSRDLTASAAGRNAKTAATRQRSGGPRQRASMTT
jgi:hypothetical protein